MTHPTDAMVEAVARAMEPMAWAAVGMADTLAHSHRRRASLRYAQAAIAAYEAKLLESGMVITTVEAALNVPVNNGHP